jgi:hypothetical protein
MSAFDEIANDAPPVALRDLAPLPSDSQDTTESTRFYAALLRVGELVLNAGSNQPKAFVKILRQACLDNLCRETVLQLSGEEAQLVVDAIQLVSGLHTQMSQLLVKLLADFG